MAAHAGGNILLETLTPRSLSTLQLTEDHHPIATELVRAAQKPDFVFFPAPGAVVSIVRSTENGSMVESAVVGNEGMFIVQAILTEPVPGNHAIVQIEGTFAKAHHQSVRELFRANEPFRDALLAYASLFLEQVTQNLVCNRLHAIEQRLAKMAARRARSDRHRPPLSDARLPGAHARRAPARRVDRRGRPGDGRPHSAQQEVDRAPRPCWPARTRVRVLRSGAHEARALPRRARLRMPLFGMTGKDSTHSVRRRSGIPVRR